MIQVQMYGGGVRWACKECDDRRNFGKSASMPTTEWTNGPVPERCPKCKTGRYQKGKD
jgi:rubrerythrin